MYNYVYTFKKEGHKNIIGNVKMGKDVEIGSFNIIEDGVVIKNGVKIGNNNIIMAGTEVGENTIIEHFVLLKPKTKIGDNTYVDSYVRSSGLNEVGNNVTLRFGCTIARSVFVGDGAFISPNVMTIYSKHTGEVSSKTVIGKKSFIGTAAVLGPNVTIGDEVVIGAQAYVSKSCIEKGVYIGVPAVFKKSL